MSIIVKVMTDHLIQNNTKNTSRRISAEDVLIYGVTFIPGIILLAAAWFQTRVPIFVLMKDPLAVVQLTGDCCRMYYGLISNLGIILWMSGAAICLFAAVLLFSNYGRDSRPIFLAAAGLFTAWLAVDDLFMVHEDVLPLLGVSQPVTYAVYAGAAALYLILSWRQIMTSRLMLMMTAMALLGTSVMIDALVHTESALHVLAEDGAKLLGILAWTSFHATAAFDLCAGSLGSLRFVNCSREAM